MRKVWVGVEGNIGPILLEAHDPYSQGKFWDSEGCSGKIAWFDTMIRGNGSIYVDLFVMVILEREWVWYLFCTSVEMLVWVEWCRPR